jgi:hypothetical protein
MDMDLRTLLHHTKFSSVFFLLRLGASAASNSAYHDYPELWTLRYPAHRYHAGIRTYG